MKTICRAVIGLECASFQVMRRANASLGRKARIDDQVAADRKLEAEAIP